MILNNHSSIKTLVQEMKSNKIWHVAKIENNTWLFLHVPFNQTSTGKCAVDGEKINKQKTEKPSKQDVKYNQHMHAQMKRTCTEKRTQKKKGRWRKKGKFATSITARVTLRLRVFYQLAPKSTRRRNWTVF